MCGEGIARPTSTPIGGLGLGDGGHSTNVPRGRHKLDVVPESVEHCSRVWEIMGSNSS